MNIVLPNATELRKVSEQARDLLHREFIANIKQSIIDSAKAGLNSVFVDDPYNGKYENEVRNLLEPLGYKVEVIVEAFCDSSSFQINW